jgi:hypothetical protein
MVTQSMKIVLGVLTVICLVACDGLSNPSATEGTIASTSPTPTLFIPSPVPIELMPTENVVATLLKLSGNGPDTSPPFTLATNTILRVKWQQFSTGKFTLSVVNLDPNQETIYREVIFESIVGPSSGFGIFEFVAGEYQVSIGEADGSWEVWVEQVELDR